MVPHSPVKCSISFLLCQNQVFIFISFFKLTVGKGNEAAQTTEQN